jgi:hypothetical protein
MCGVSHRRFLGNLISLTAAAHRHVLGDNLTHTIECLESGRDETESKTSFPNFTDS